MASRHQFSKEEIKEIEQARKNNKDKRAEARLNALELRAKSRSLHQIGSGGFPHRLSAFQDILSQHHAPKKICVMLTWKAQICNCL